MTRSKPIVRACGSAAAAALVLAGCHSTKNPPPDEVGQSQAALVSALPTPTLVKDLVTTGFPSSASSPSNQFVFGNKMLFTATSAQYGNELWITDGTVPGTILLQDINPGAKDSSVTPLYVVNGKVVFSANDGAHGNELWVTDGTPAGTQLLKDIFPGTADSFSYGLQATDLLPGAMLFFANDGVHGTELWKTDGTPQGTVLVKDAAPGANSATTGGTWAKVGSKVVFSLDDGVNGSEPWVTDGTSLGTVMLELRPGSMSSKPGTFVTWNGKAYFRAFDPLDTDESTYELAVTDGTPAGTQYIDVNPTGPSDPRNLTAAGDKLYFTASQPDSPPFVKDVELWKTDGTLAGTTKVKDINPGDGNASPGSLTVVGNILFFMANDGTHGTEPWRTDGTAAGTFLLADVTPGSDGSYPYPIAMVNGRWLLGLSDGYGPTSRGTEWWVSDGTVAGTGILKDIAPGSDSSYPSYPVLVGTTLFFTASEGYDAASHGTELWKTDGTAAGTSLVADIRPGSSSSNPSDLVALNGKLYFSASNGTAGAGVGREPWVSDGTAAGTTLVADVNPGSSSSSPGTFMAVHGNLVFTGDNGEGTELAIVPNFTGIPAIVDINPSLFSAFTYTPEQFTPFNSKLFFVTDSDSTVGAELYSTDGTAAGTGIVVDLKPGGGGALQQAPSYLTPFNGALYFNADGPSGTAPPGNELWKTDGTVAGTTLVKDISSDWGGGSPRNIVAAGSHLFFSAGDGWAETAIGQEPWVSDGTTAGTVPAKNIAAGNMGSNPGTFFPLGNKVIFQATSDYDIYGTEPWVSDGTAAGTQLLVDVIPGPIGSGMSATAAEMDGFLYLAIDDAGDMAQMPYGYELWRTDGTPAGTTLVKDIRPGTDSSTPAGFVTLGHQVLFTATTDAEGTELWITDGTATGTKLVKDILPGFGSSSPSELTEVYGAVYFAATDATGGRELWKTDGTAAGTVRVKDINLGAGSSIPVQLARFGNVLLFGASDGTTGREMWQSDGTSAGTVRLGDLWPGIGSSEPGKAVQVGPRGYFLATTPTQGREIFSTTLPTQDTVAPMITCPPDFTAITGVEGAGAQQYPPAHGYDDHGGAVTFTYSQASGATFPLGQTTVTVTGADSANNTATCSFKVTRTYVDQEPPVITCPTARSVVSHALAGTAVTFTATATDNKTASPTITYDYAPNSTFTVGTTTVTATATDAASNTATCSFDVMVTFEDNTPPTVTCPSNVATVVHANTPTTMIFGAATATDDAPGEVTISYSAASGTLYPVGINTVTATATDAANNVGTCTFTVTVAFVDNTPPVISCPSTVAIDSPFAEGIAANWTSAAAIDTDSGLDPAITYSVQPGSTLPLGDTLVLATATDSGGNTDTCAFHVVVTLVDTTNPEITCPSTTTAITEVRKGTIVTYPGAIATDNLAPAPTVSYSKASGELFPLGDTTITAKATDGFGNTAQCDFVVSVMLVDTTKPEITCPSDAIAVAHENSGVEVSYPSATAIDNLTANLAITYSKASGSRFPVGDTTVTATATDDFDNSGSCTFKVSVSLVDVGLPTLTCPQDMSVSAKDTSGIEVTWTDAVASDNIDTTIAVTYEPANGTRLPVGASTVTATAKDKAGNAAQCTFHVTVTGVSNSGCGCQAVDPGTIFGFAGLLVLLRRRRRT